MIKKKAFILRVNEEALAAIEKWASDEFRSTNGQVSIYYIKLSQKPVV
jgi:hypothetical protein